MTDPSILVHSMPEIPRVETFIGVCCREWVLALGYPLGSCGLCGERPQAKALIA
jgi:hypothetical protein